VGARRLDGKASVVEKVGGVVDVPAVVACVLQWGKKMSLCFLFLFF
jgi:hypothetical protein